MNVLALGENNDVSVFRNLLALGVSDYLVKPLNMSLVATRLKGMLQQENKEVESAGFSHSGHIISFLGVRGGVGTSTLAVNHSVSLAEDHNKHVSLVDFNLASGSVAQILNVSLNAGLMDILQDPARIDQEMLERLVVQYGNRLEVLSSEADVMAPYSQCALGMKKVLGLLAQRYHYTVVDCSYGVPSSFKELVFKSSDTIVLVCDLTFSSVRETSRLVRYFKENSNLEQKLLVLANNVGQYKMGEISQSNFEEAISHPVTFVTHFDGDIPLESLNSATPFVKEKCKLSNEVKAFAAHLIGGPLEKKEESFFKSVFGT